MENLFPSETVSLRNSSLGDIHVPITF
jgi:hypothetical protein